MNKNIKYIILAALTLLTAATATAQRELHLYTNAHHYDGTPDSAYVWAAFDASRVDSIKVIDHIDVAPAWIKAEVEGYRVHITWEGVENVPRYRVFRSHDGENWSDLTWTDGTCEAYDENPLFGANYYKVCAVSISTIQGPSSEVANVEVEPYIYAYNTFFLPMGRRMETNNMDYNHDTFGLMSRLLALDVMSEDIAFGANSFFRFDYQLDYWGAPYVRTYQYWYFFYNLIASANQSIMLLEDNPATTGEKWLLAQAYALRGLAYMYLIQVYSDYMTVGESEGMLTAIDRETKGVPILYTEYDGKTAEGIEAALGRNTVGDVLDEAERNLQKGAQLGYDDDVRNYNTNLPGEGISYQAVEGLLARYYLLTQQWQNAADAANAARQGYGLRTPDGLFDGFMDVYANDVLWGFNHTADTQTTYASFFSHMSNDTPGYAGLDFCPKFIDARLYSQIPDDDLRKQLFNSASGDAKASYSGAKKPYAARKFGWNGDWTMDYIYMRAAEMALIAAEAYARLGQNGKAAEVLKQLMDQRIEGAWNETSLSVEDVLLQRRIELWGEGFSYFDLKRNNKGIGRNYDESNHLDDFKLTVPAHDVRWTYQIPVRAFNDNTFRLDQETDQNP